LGFRLSGIGVAVTFLSRGAHRLHGFNADPFSVGVIQKMNIFTNLIGSQPNSTPEKQKKHIQMYDTREVHTSLEAKRSSKSMGKSRVPTFHIVTCPKKKI
jgi:hypothetical protein